MAHEQEKQVKQKAFAQYEPACIQHTRAALALTAVIGAMQKFAPPPELHDLMAKILQAIDACAKSTPKKYLSQGARRDLAEACDVLGPWLEDYPNLHPDICFFRFSTVCYCGLTLIEDVCNICPACTEKNLTSWQALRGHLTNLCDGLMEMEPGIDRSGSDLYECMDDARTGHKEIIPIKNMAYAYVHHKAA